MGERNLYQQNRIMVEIVSMAFISFNWSSLIVVRKGALAGINIKADTTKGQRSASKPVGDSLENIIPFYLTK